MAGITKRKKTLWNNRKRAVAFRCGEHVITVRETWIERRGRREKVIEVDAPECVIVERVKA